MIKDKEIVYHWDCPKCGAAQKDTRQRFVMCGNCGATYDAMPLQKPLQKGGK
jgi:hypothetical protein